jgi:hypothetical protein
VVLEESRREVRPEAAPRPRRHSLRPQHGDDHDGEPATVGRDPLGRCPRDVERPVVAAHDRVQDLVDPPQVDAIAILLGERHAVHPDQKLVDHEALHDPGQPGHVGRQPVEQRCVLARRRHHAGLRES